MKDNSLENSIFKDVILFTGRNVSVDKDTTFSDIGLSSKDILLLSSELSENLGRNISPVLFWRYTKIHDFCRVLSKGEDIDELESSSDLCHSSDQEPIAIIGIGCRFPGASTPDQFWRNLCEGVDSVSNISDLDRPWLGMDLDPKADFYDHMKCAGLIDDVLDFDHFYFNISSDEASKMDPQQRLLLSVSVDTFEDAGLVLGDYNGSSVGVFVGYYHSDYGSHAFFSREYDLTCIAGSSGSICANRISYQFNFMGPSVAIDTACSSSLTAVHLACQSIQQGDSSIALAAGSNIILDTKLTKEFARAGMLSPTGRCHTFSSNADGFVRGEGVGMVLLKPLSKAVIDKNKIYGVLCSSSINQDGLSNGLTAPNPESQEKLLFKTYKKARIDPSEIQYIELHGTGTALGDPIEADSISRFLIKSGSKKDCLVGSVKTNIGHLESAAGVAGLIKTVLCIHHKLIPASLFFESPNPLIPFENVPIAVSQKLNKFDESRPIVAGVSSFGFGGSNAHVCITDVKKASELFSIGSMSKSNEKKVCFIFPGFSEIDYSSIYALLNSESEFRNVIYKCHNLIEKFLGWSLVDRLKSDSYGLWDQPFFSFPAVFSIQVALAKQWIFFGIEPYILMGHSLGEFSAAYISGSISLGDAISIVCSIAKENLSCDCSGDVLLVKLGVDSLQQVIEKISPSNAYLAGENSKNWNLLGVSNSVMDQFSAHFQENNIRYERLNVNHPYHTPLVTSMVDKALERLSNISSHPPRYPIFSTSKGTFIKDGFFDLDYWHESLTKKVKFKGSLLTVISNDVDALIEVSSTESISNLLISDEDFSSTCIVPTGKKGKDIINSYADSIRFLQRKEIMCDWNSLHQFESIFLSNTKDLIFTFSAKTKKALDSFLLDMMHVISNISDSDLPQLAFTLARHRDHYECRKSIVSSTKENLLDAIKSYLSSTRLPRFQGKKVGLVFSGQGNQWAGMARDFYKSQPTFRSYMLKIDRFFSKYSDWSIVARLLSDDLESDLENTEIMQPIIFSIQASMLHVLKKWNIPFDGVVGHSLGEIASAFSSGMIGLKDALFLSWKRGRLLQKLKGRGGMILIKESEKKVRELILDYSLSIAALNSPMMTVISGGISEIEDVKKLLIYRDISFRDLQGFYPFHSSLIDEKDSATYLKEFKMGLPEVPFYSTSFSDQDISCYMDNYWIYNVRNTVHFHSAIKEMIKDGFNLFIEVGVDQILSSSIIDSSPEDLDVMCVSLFNRKKDQNKHCYEGFSFLYECGYNIDWSEMYKGSYHPVHFPHYPWQKERCWIDSLEKPVGIEPESDASHLPDKDSVSPNDVVSDTVKSLLASDKIDFEAPLVSIGMNSLIAAQLIRKIKKSLGVKLTFKDLMLSKSLNNLISLIEEKIS